MNKEQLALYQARIGVESGLEPSVSNLEILMKKHLTSVPFENLDVFDKHLVPKCDEESLFEKIVVNRRGGYCFELNAIFYRLLQAMGYEVYPIGVRIMFGRTELRPILHRGTIAVIDGKKWLADIGYGGPGPKAPLLLEDGDHEIWGGTYRVITVPKRSRYDSNDVIKIQVLKDGQFLDVFFMKDEEMEEVDFELSNFFCAKSDDSAFTAKRIVNLTLEDGSKALTDNTLTIRRGGNVETRELNDKALLMKALSEEFGIEIIL